MKHPEKPCVFALIRSEEKLRIALISCTSRKKLFFPQNMALLMKGHTLSEFLPEHKQMLYTYDMGDNWEHEIQLVRVIEDHEKESPYLLEASGQTPPEDVGGVGGFVNFREIMLNPSHPEYEKMKEWAKYWTIDLSDWKSRSRVIRY